MLLIALIAVVGASDVPPAPNETVTVEAARAAAAAKKVTCTYDSSTGSRTSRTRVCMTGAERALQRELTRNDLTQRMKDSIGTPNR